MELTEAKYTRKFNLGDFESEEFSLSGRLEVNESGAEALLELKADVEKAHEGVAFDSKEKTKEKESNEQRNSKKSSKDGKSAGKKDQGSDDESTPNDEGPEHEASDDDHDNAEDAEGGQDESEPISEAEAAGVIEDEDQVEDKKPGKGKGAPKGKESAKEQGKKSFKRKPQTYDRSIEAHKQLFAGVVATINPDWKNSEDSKKNAKKASEKLEGEAFLDESGEILEAFKTKLKKLVK